MIHQGDQPSAPGLDRRRFMQFGAGVALSGSLAALLAACGGDDDSSSATSATSTAGTPAPSTGASTAASSATTSATVTSLALQLPWTINVQSAGELMAREKGFFAEHGLDVDLKVGGPNIQAIPLVAQGDSEVGISYAPNLLLARAEGVPVRSFAAAVQKAPLGYFSLKDTGITSVADWKGKKVGQQVGGEIFIKAMLATAGLTLDDVTIVQVAADPTPLLVGQVDLWPAWVINLEQLGEIEQRSYNVQTLWDNGIRFQSNYYFAHEDRLGDTPTLAGLLSAVSKGWAYALDNPEETLDVVISENNALDRDLQHRQLVEYLPSYVFNELTATNGWGWLDLGLWGSTIDLFTTQGALSKPVTVEDIATLDILDAAGDREKRG